jgi:DNA modification methylase/DNA-directed RNA polymerase subunit RPC12/RpoP
MKERKLTKEDIDRVRNVEGFPIAEDEDIIALSHPPHYTACPNPFMDDFIREHSTQYDEATDEYHREPFSADISEGKNDPIYMAHSYHTKVPHKAIMRYILHYTKPGDIVLDGFCGTGMTGVAAQMCGCPDADFKYLLEHEMRGIEWGVRHAILSDLSPAAIFITFNYNLPVDIQKYKEEITRILRECETEHGWMYETQHVNSNGMTITGFGDKPVLGKINYTVWSDVLVCPSCSKELIYWDVAVDVESGHVLDYFGCPYCGSSVKKTECAHAQISILDEELRTMTSAVKQVPVMISYSVGSKRFKKTPDAFDIDTVNRIKSTKVPFWVPTDEIPNGYNTAQPKNSHGITHVHQFYSRRNLIALSAIWEKARQVDDDRVSWFLCYTLTSVFSRSHKLNRYMPNHFRHVGPLSGTLYIPTLQAEISIFDLLAAKAKNICRVPNPNYGNIISCQSTTDLSNIPSNSVDYIFTDPPFGNNLNYSELNFLMESWLRIFTANTKEAVINDVQHKALNEYLQLMSACFREYYRVLKPGRWITIEFHNSQNAVWNAIQEALGLTGFVVANIEMIDKQKGTTKQLSYASAVKQDLVIAAYKPRESFIREFEQSAGDPEMAWEFVRQHLQNVPIAPDSTGKIEIVNERLDYLLFDRMVAFHIMKGIPVPMDAHTFYAGLRERFMQRDGMFFLPDQVNEYDERRKKMELQDQQLSLFVTDEKSAIIWLNEQLGRERQTYAEIQPKFLQDWHRNKFEQMPELLDMLKENFLQDEDGKWYVPNLSDKADLEKLRRKRLLRDFYDIYAKGTGRIRNARTEAIRVGFDECWKERNYSLIVKVGDRLPENVLQEDPALLMYYDNASIRM